MEENLDGFYTTCRVHRKLFIESKNASCLFLITLQTHMGIFRRKLLENLFDAVLHAPYKVFRQRRTHCNQLYRQVLWRDSR